MVNEVKIVRSDDNSKIRAIELAVFRFEAEHGVGERLKAQYTRFLAGAKNNAPLGVFALVNGVLVGGLTYHLHNDWVFIHCGYVSEQYRGTGVYSAIMSNLETHAKAFGLSGLMVSTYTFESPEIYEHMGFLRGCVLTNCPEGNTSIDYCKDFFVQSEPLCSVDTENEGYPCRGRDCYECGNYHASCCGCPLYGAAAK